MFFHKSAVAFLLSLIIMLSLSGCAETQTNEPEMQSSSKVESSLQSQKNNDKEKIDSEIMKLNGTYTPLFSNHSKAMKNALNFDHYKNQLLWCEKDGVWMAESDGSNANLVISNSSISDFMTLEANDQTSNLSYVHPRFICNGSKIVAAVYSEKNVYYQGFIIFDLMNHVAEKCVQTKHQELLDYPYLDRYVRVFCYEPIYLDALKGELYQLPKIDFTKGFSTYDFQTFLFSRYKGPAIDERGGLNVYVCDKNNLDDRTHRIINNYGDEEVILSGVTNHYAVISIPSRQDGWWALVRYQ